ncbi:MAG: BMP family ABC transporter substrate-binding protein [Lachnospiraceae bacterium]|nr:BMP family ABC transporter substrate-binding protein [Lachnospiraceae bacterium]
MKKLLAIVMSISLSAVMLVGCGGQASNAGGATEDSAKGNASDAKIAVVCDAAGQNDNGYNQSAAKGAELCAEKYGIETKVVEPTQSIGDTLSQLAEDGYNLIFSMEYDFDALINGEAGGKPIAEMYPDTTFVVFNATPNVDEAGKTIHDNVISVLYNVNESSYLAGALSVLANENQDVLFGDAYKLTKPDTARGLGFIGGSDSDGITVFSVGFIEGAQKMAGELGVNYDFYAKYDAGFSDSATGSTVAGTYYDQGANVVYACAGAVGDGVTSKAKEVGKLAIQVDANKDDQQPGFVLTSVIKNTEVVVQSMTEALTDGKLGDFDRITTYDLGSGSTTITDLATISQHIEQTDAAKTKWQEIKDKVAQLQSDISDGKIKVTNTQNGDTFDPSTCPNISIK